MQRILRFHPFALVLLLPACSHSGGGGSDFAATITEESEPNDSSAHADVLAADHSGSGSLEQQGDEDWWAIDLVADTEVSVEFCSSRFASDQWATESNNAMIEVVDSDGATVLLTQDTTVGVVWQRDPDLLVFRPSATGTYYLHVKNNAPEVAGASYLFHLSERPVPDVVQVEAEAPDTIGANDALADAEAIVPGTVRGYHLNDDVDFYSFTVTEPVVVEFSLLTYRTGVYPGQTERFDPVLTLYDVGENTLFDRDDAYYYDTAYTYYLTDPGDYYLEVRECCGDADAPYWLDFSMTPIETVAEVEPNDTTDAAQALTPGEYVQGDIVDSDTDYYSIEASLGDIVRVTYFGADHYQGVGEDSQVAILTPGAEEVDFFSSGSSGTLRYLATEAGTYWIAVSGNNSMPYLIRGEIAASSTAEVEPNEELVDATALVGTDLMMGNIDEAGDLDSYSFQAEAGIPVTLFVMAVQRGASVFEAWSSFQSDVVPSLTVVDADGRQVAHGNSSSSSLLGVDDATGSCELTFIPQRTGTYYLRLRNLNTELTVGESSRYLVGRQ